MLGITSLLNLKALNLPNLRPSNINLHRQIPVNILPIILRTMIFMQSRKNSLTLRWVINCYLIRNTSKVGSKELDMLKYMQLEHREKVIDLQYKTHQGFLNNDKGNLLYIALSSKRNEEWLSLWNLVEIVILMRILVKHNLGDQVFHD